jgi:hypothetical protein
LQKQAFQVLTRTLAFSRRELQVMTKLIALSAGSIVIAYLLGSTLPLNSAVISGDGKSVNLFADNSGHVPPTSEYDGPLFSLSHDYPKEPVAPPANPPWREALNGKPISAANSGAYVQALKDYVSQGHEQPMSNPL